MKYITPKILKTFVFSTTVYLLALLAAWGDDLDSTIFGKLAYVLFFIAPVVIVLDAVFSILKEMRKDRND